MKPLTKEEIKNVINDIKKSIVCDVGPLFDVYLDKNNLDRCTGSVQALRVIPRLLFPEIDGLGQLRYGYYGADSKYPVQFMEEYFTRPEYKKISGYRHGLIHSHWPKIIIIDNKAIGWQMTISQRDPLLQKGHLTCPDKKKTHLNISAIEFYDDFLAAIDKYMEDFENSDTKKVNELIENFSKVYFKIHEPECKKSVLLKSASDFFK